MYVYGYVCTTCIHIVEFYDTLLMYRYGYLVNLTITCVSFGLIYSR